MAIYDKTDIYYFRYERGGDNPFESAAFNRMLRNEKEDLIKCINIFIKLLGKSIKTLGKIVPADGETIYHTIEYVIDTYGIDDIILKLSHYGLIDVNAKRLIVIGVAGKIGKTNRGALNKANQRANKEESEEVLATEPQPNVTNQDDVPF